jgi:membrane associated rhomboid family serine protease
VAASDLIRPQERSESFIDQEFVTYKRMNAGKERRRMTGVVVAMGFTAVNGYIWYNWLLAQPESMVSSNGGYIRATFSDQKSKALHAFMLDNFTVSAKNWDEHRWHTLLTAGFSHQSMWHLAANTIGVISFFPIVSVGLGVPLATISYLACIAGGSLLMLHQKGIDLYGDVKDVLSGKVEYGAKPEPVYGSSFQDELARLVGFEVPSWSITEQKKRRDGAKAFIDQPGLGASAGVCGLFTISTLMAPSAGVAIFFIPLPAWLAWGLLTGVDAYCTINEEARKKFAETIGISVGHEAHLGGTLTGVFTGLLFFRRLFR